MDTSNRLPAKKTLSQPDNLEWVRQSLADSFGLSLKQFCIQTCEHFGFLNSRGEPQIGNCALALRALDDKGLISLQESLGYKSSGIGRPHEPRCLDAPVPQPSGLPEDAGKIGELKVVMVTTPEQLLTWNTVINGEHYLGAKTPLGRQIKYLVYADGELAAAAGFCSAMRKIRERDVWIGWSPEERDRLRDSMLACLNRYLVREGAHGCANFASMALGALIGAVRKDWPAKYGAGISLLETFVDPKRFEGTSYKATNWISIGRTSGRGRDDRNRKANLGKKDVYIYMLDPGFRKRYGFPSPEERALPAWVRAAPAELAEGLTSQNWARHEFGSSKLEHKDRVDRLVFSAERLASSPQTSASAAFGADMPARTAWYRFVSRSKTTPEGILSGHMESTMMRAKGRKVVLFAQDTMIISLAGKKRTEGLGSIWTNGRGADVSGLYSHPLVAIAPGEEGGDGVLLGVVGVEFWARKPGGKGPKKLPPDQRESAVWRRSAQTVDELARHLPGTLAVTLCDRGGDDALLLSECRKMKHCEIIVRARADRRLPGEPRTLFPTMAYTPPCGTTKVTMGRVTERRNNAGKVIVTGRPEMTVELDVIFRRVTLPPPREKPENGPVEVVCVTAAERGRPKGRPLIRWHLLTTMDVKCFKDAEEVVHYYAERWIIEEFHGMLKKDCCDIEELAYRTAHRLKNVIAVYMVVAWWLMFILQLARTKPDLPPETVFDEVEMEEIQLELQRVQKKKIRQLKTLRDYVCFVAMMGGYSGYGPDWWHPHGPPPGYETFARGYAKLQTMCCHVRWKRKQKELARAKAEAENAQAA